MNNETRQEILKAYIYGVNSQQISEITGESVDAIEHLILECEDEIAEKKVYMKQLGCLSTNNAVINKAHPAMREFISGSKTYYGIDISVWNGWVDMNKVKASGKDFVFIRSGYGNVAAYPNQVDSRFSENVKNARAAGLAFGVYHYSYATTVAAAKAEAAGFIKQLDSIRPIPYLIMFDFEERSQYNLSAATKGAICNAFLGELKAHRYLGTLYSYESFLSTMNVSDRNQHIVWCANISRAPAISYQGWQYSFTGKVNGISGDVDLDQTNIDYVTVIKAGGYNGYKKDTNVLDTNGFKKGDKSLGVYFLKRWLIGKGYKLDDNETFGEGTEKAVNSILGASGNTRNGIAGKGFAKKFIK